MRKEHTWNKRGLFGILIMLMVLTVPLALAAPTAPAIYINPESRGLTCGENTTVEVRINTTDMTYFAQAWIHFNPACVNITDVDYTGAAWQPLQPPGWSHQGDYVIVATANFYPGVDLGDHLFANITIECVGDSCMSDIWFDTLDPVYPRYNGTFTCEAPAPNVVVTVNNASFGTMLAGNRQELKVSLTLNNTGTVDANITAVFKTNVTGTYGLNGTGENIIPGNYFELGPDGDEKALTNTTVTTFISTILAGVEVTYDAILEVPAGQTAGDYSGIVELIIEESS